MTLRRYNVALQENLANPTCWTLSAENFRPPFSTIWRNIVQYRLSILCSYFFSVLLWTPLFIYSCIYGSYLLHCTLNRPSKYIHVYRVFLNFLPSNLVIGTGSSFLFVSLKECFKSGSISATQFHHWKLLLLEVLFSDLERNGTLNS